MTSIDPQRDSLVSDPMRPAIACMAADPDPEIYKVIFVVECEVESAPSDPIREGGWSGLETFGLSRENFGERIEEESKSVC